MKSKQPETVSGNYTIQPDTTKDPFTVFCDMNGKNGTGVTVFGHDSEEKTHVNGYEENGSYRRVIKYNGQAMNQIEKVITSSLYCEQFIKYDCKGSVFFFNHSLYEPSSWWVSRQGYKMKYWGGATPGSKSCACGMTMSCRDERTKCNCDSNDYTQWLEDSGWLVDRQRLPVSELRFGDTGDEVEEGYYTLGKLLCWG